METVVFTDPETGEVAEFLVEEETELNGNKYLLVSEELDGEYAAYILKEAVTEDDEILYEMLEDDVEFQALAKVFSELVDEETDIEY